MVKLTERRPFANPEAAMRKILEIATAFASIQEGRIDIEALNGPMIHMHKATPAEYNAGLDLAIARGLLKLHESGTHVKLTSRRRVVA
jgi:hypothetical protein